MKLQPAQATEGEWISWRIDGRAGAKLRLGPVFLGEISYPHDFGLGARWKAWLNHEHLGFFRDEGAARARIESEIAKRLSLMQPAWAKFQRVRSTATLQRQSTWPRAIASPGRLLPRTEDTAPMRFALEGANAAGQQNIAAIGGWCPEEDSKSSGNGQIPRQSGLIAH